MRLIIFSDASFTEKLKSEWSSDTLNQDLKKKGVLVSRIIINPESYTPHPEKDIVVNVWKSISEIIEKVREKCLLYIPVSSISQAKWSKNIDKIVSRVEEELRNIWAIESPVDISELRPLYKLESFLSKSTQRAELNIQTTETESFLINGVEFFKWEMYFVAYLLLKYGNYVNVENIYFQTQKWNIKKSIEGLVNNINRKAKKSWFSIQKRWETYTLVISDEKKKENPPAKTEIKLIPYQRWGKKIFISASQSIITDTPEEVAFLEYLIENNFTAKKEVFPNYIHILDSLNQKVRLLVPRFIFAYGENNGSFNVYLKKLEEN